MLSETLQAVRTLLRGERLSTSGRYVTLDGVALEVPPDVVPLVSAGVRGPKSLRISGRDADGTIMADFINPAYLRWAREQIAEGATSELTPESTSESTPASAHRVTVFATSAIGLDGDEMRRAVTPLLAGVCADAPLSLRMAPFFDELAEQAGRSSWEDAVGAMPVEWWHDIAAVGTPDDAAEYLSRLGSAGADAVAMFPSFVDAINDVRRTGELLLKSR